MVLRFSILAVAFLLSCTSIERDSVCDEKSIYYNGCVVGVSSSSSGGGRFIDSRDNKSYRYVKIGYQTWMAENLNYNEPGSKCYDNDLANCAAYGRLYNWATAMALDASCNSSPCSQAGTKHKGICPSGWYIPNDNDWIKLVNYVESENYCSDCAAAYLKSNIGWNGNGNGNDKYGFSALPGGDGGSDGYFSIVGNFGYWWSSTEHGTYNAYSRYIGYDRKYADIYDSGKSLFRSVRCLQY
ncbi:MAG: hypothetical protein FWF63_04960 [Fibromonadales bacterium]|nr:hypothetical protein [Fibromonadales bacterium]